MRKLCLGALLCASIFLAGGSTSVQAQKSKETKADKTGVIEITEGKDGKFRFFVRDWEGKFLAQGGPGGWETEKEAKAAVEELKAVIAKATIVKGAKKSDTKGKMKDNKEKK